MRSEQTDGSSPAQSEFEVSKNISSAEQLPVLEAIDSREQVEVRETFQAPSRGFRFWIIFLAICVCLFLSALEYSAVSTALPTIVHDLHGADFVWVASAYALAATALLPATGGIAQVFGRRPCMLLSLGMFALGSALCGAAKNMNWLIAARTVQGAGGGGILAMSSIVISDLVPLRERPIYNSFIGLTWAIAAGIGPVVGGSLAQQGRWRWLFYLNLPLTAVAAALIIIFLNVKTPRGSFREKLARMDWIGNGLVIGSASSVVIALTWGGVRYPWVSVHTLTPLILGLIGLVFFLIYEVNYAKNALIPAALISNRTSLSGYLQTFIAPILTFTVLYFIPIYYQACWGSSPTRSGVLLFGLVLPCGVFLLVTGASIAITKRYRPQLWLGWALYVAGMGVLSTLHVGSTIARATGGLALLGFASAILYASTYYPVLAPLPVAQNAPALALFAFFRSFAGVWGVTLGTAVLQTQLARRLPADFVAQFPGGVSIAYSVIPSIPALEEPFRTEVRAAFADSLKVLWEVMIGVAGLGLLASVLMKGLPLHTQVDEAWGMEEEKGRRPDQGDIELQNQPRY
ncbi:hypothetical protein PHLGIDRAFT_77045 [Phlebiopsis gigantea 11061_1 CR5-6]|uniref:Major facilitator superfamily (MFS) profile domain-containing protein n=1 Tax=Phlebiopsis gigantea (strain 11061_1 CR5-6) TaxID=745531 RepID=A0A0C3RT57_PHLG1|nr:hypothetical protein PHLGIDRAFT_77045 [Phlebiopsis gigantea 11061_1 CR5-6]